MDDYKLIPYFCRWKNERFESGPYNTVLYDKIDKICYKLCNNVDIPKNCKVLMPCTIDSENGYHFTFNRLNSPRYNAKMNPETVIVDYSHKVDHIDIKLPDGLKTIYPFFLMIPLFSNRIHAFKPNTPTMLLLGESLKHVSARQYENFFTNVFISEENQNYKAFNQGEKVGLIDKNTKEIICL